MRRSSRLESFDDPLGFVFSQARTTLLTRDEERRYSEQLWTSRRRLEILLDRARRAAPDSEPIPEVTPHQRPIPPDTVKRLLSVEQDARRGAGSNSLRRSIAAELDRIDEARTALVRGNLRLVAWVLKRFQGKGLEVSDLFQEGAIALLESVSRFDPARGNRLSTYATRGIELRLVRALAEKGRMVRIPLHRLREVIDASTAWNKLRATLEREPTEEEVSSLSGVPRSQLSELAPALRPVASTDAAAPGTELPLSDVLADDGASPFEQVAASEAIDLAERALAALPVRERRILKLRYGIGISEEKSFEAIGRVVGLSRERSRQLTRSALEKMRAALQSGAPRAMCLEGSAC